MQEEVFGPILPILEIDSIQGVVDWVNRNLHPLGLYIFAEDHDVVDQILDATESGDAVVNDCSIHPPWRFAIYAIATAAAVSHVVGERRCGDRRGSRTNGAMRWFQIGSIVLRRCRCTVMSWTHTRTGGTL